MTGQLRRRQFCRRRRHSRNRIHMTLSNDLLKSSPECLPKRLHTQRPHSAKLSQGRLENSLAQLSHALVHTSLYPAQQIVQGQDSTVFGTYENQPSILDYPGLKKKSSLSNRSYYSSRDRSCYLKFTSVCNQKKQTREY